MTAATSRLVQRALSASGPWTTIDTVTPTATTYNDPIERDSSHCFASPKHTAQLRGLSPNNLNHPNGVNHQGQHNCDL